MLTDCWQTVSITCMYWCVQCWTPDDGQRNCSKHVEFYSKNKFEKLVHLVGFIIRIYGHLDTVHRLRLKYRINIKIQRMDFSPFSGTKC